MCMLRFESLVNSDRYQTYRTPRRKYSSLRALLIQIGIKLYVLTCAVKLCLRALLIQIGIKQR